MYVYFFARFLDGEALPFAGDTLRLPGDLRPDLEEGETTSGLASGI